MRCLTRSNTSFGIRMVRYKRRPRLGLAYWYGSRRTEAFVEWNSVASTSLDSTIEEGQRRGLTALLMMVLQQVADVVGRAQGLKEEERAVVGTFDRDLNAIAPYWKPPQIVLLATDLASIAASVGRDDKAYHWIDRAAMTAREINEATVTRFVAMEAFPWALLRNDFANAARFVIELRHESSAPAKPGESEIAQYVLLASFQLGMLSLTEPDQARGAWLR